jgi:hypothetical protein
MDGPFAEPKEAIAGFFIVQVVSSEDAVETAKGGAGLAMEVRPIGLEPGELQFAWEVNQGGIAGSSKFCHPRSS